MISISEIKGFSHQGVRENNEDYIKYASDIECGVDTRVVVLCDGMGGHGHGEIASRTVAESVFQTLDKWQGDYSEDDLQLALDNALIALNEADVYADDKKMGTTLVVVVVNRNDVLVGHVGDSRCYQFDENSVRMFRTKDHSKVAEAVEAEILTEEEAINSEYKNVLTRCVIAGKTNVKIDVDRLDIGDKDRLLLCTDGVVDALRDDEISELLVDRSIGDALNLIDSKCDGKSHDNYSAILVEFHRDSSSENPNEGLPTIDDVNSTEIFDDGNQEMDKLRSELAYMKHKYRKRNLSCNILCAIIGFVFALLVCSLVSYLILDRVYGETKKEKNTFMQYESQVESMVNALCAQNSIQDSMIMKKELAERYRQINLNCSNVNAKCKERKGGK